MARDTLNRFSRATIRQPAEEVLAYCNQCARAGNFPYGYHVPSHVIASYGAMCGYELVETIIPPKNERERVVRSFQLAYAI